jgi:HAD superfamily hydrolase (TIGR01509 family)
MPKIKTVIFDIDGTLVDSVDLHAQAWTEAFYHFGHAVNFTEVRRQIGKGGDQLLPVFLSKQELEEHGAELEEYRQRLFKERYLSQVMAFPAVRQLVQRLLSDGKRVALASSAKQEELEKYKQIAHIEDLIETETSSDDAEKSKPHPDIFQAALARLGQPSPAQTLVIGDTPYDAEAAAKAGIHTIGVLCGGWSAKELQQAGCIAVYQDPADLLTHYLDSALTSKDR